MSFPCDDGELQERILIESLMLEDEGMESVMSPSVPEITIFIGT